MLPSMRRAANVRDAVVTAAREQPGGLALHAILAAAVVAGVAIRIWILRTPAIGYLDSDEAVPGLMARHFLHGELSTFYWGQSYGGTPEIALLAAVFSVTGSTVWALRLVPLTLYAVAAVVVWRIGRRTVGEPAARIAGVLFWIWPAYFVFRSTREYGYYGVLLVCGLLVVLLALRLRERPRLEDAAVLGVVLGLGWWCSVQIALVALPTLAWLVWRRPRVVAYAPVALALAAVTASPWIVENVRSGWSSLDASPGARLARSYGYRLGGFFTDALPTVLGFRVPFTLQWLPQETVGEILVCLVAVALVVVAFRRRRALEPLVAIVIVLPFLYALSGFTYDRIEPRYLELLAPLLAVVVAALLTDVRVAAVALAAAVGLSFASLVELRDAGGIAPGAPDVRAPTTVEPLVDVLDRHGVTRARADYWVAYRVTFLTRERIVVAPNEGSRYPPYDERVAESDRVARIFVAGSRSEAPARAPLLADGYTRVTAGPYVVYVPPPTR
jgi:4-amino-4-deoxy-L-arabinose transferase-like glycosyltransferase